MLEGKKVYLSGPMTGKPHYNVDQFAIAEAICRKECGATTVYNPAAAWVNERLPSGVQPTHEDYMRISIHELTRRGVTPNSIFYQHLVLLDGWAESEGARLEYQVARACGIQVIDLCDVEDMRRGEQGGNR